MRLDLLESPRPIPGYAKITSRQMVAEDAPNLAHVMFRAYRGTTDDEGETEDDALEEILRTFDGTYGPFNWAASAIAEADGAIIAATLITTFNERPLLVYSFTCPDHQRQGIARMLISRSAAVLWDQRASELTLVVTRTNRALGLYHQLGFVSD